MKRNFKNNPSIERVSITVIIHWN